MTKRYLSLIIGFFLLSTLFLGCEENRQLHDLKNYVTQLKQKVTHAQKKEVSSEFNLPIPAKYGTGSGMEVSKKEGTKNPLLAYPLKSLQLVGTVTENQKISAYLMTPDTMVYQVKEGDIIGDSYGKIVKIYSGHIEVLQKNAAGSTREQVITLRLKE
jgi:Tfp pilus assembly protein PilP